MRFTNKFPYTNINNINLDWIIKRVKELGETVLSYAQDIANAVALAEAAQEAADSVTGTAESAVTTAQAAEATANAIAGTANTALATAQAAETTAQAAETTAQAAEERAENAETLAGTASANASNAGQTANTALATAQAAEATAEAAETTAQAAETTAQAAETTAQAAETTAQAASAALNEKAGALITTESGAIVSFVPDTTIDNYQLGVTVDIEPVQAGSGTPSPDNVRPLSGTESAHIMHSGADTSTPTTHTVPLGQSVYGGTLDLKTGMLTIDMAIVDLGTLTPYKTPTNVFMWHVLTPTNGTILCSNYATAQSGLLPSIMSDKTVCTTDAIGTYYPVALKDTAYAGATAAEMQTAMSGVQLVYELITPITIQLDPVQISAIIGQSNNIWADAGNVTVEFAADLKWYIDSKIAEVQALALENGG